MIGGALPATLALEAKGTHRLIAAKYAAGGVLAPLADDERERDAVYALDGATSGRLSGEQRGLAGIASRELVWGVKHESIIRAAYLYPSPRGGRFNGLDRGCWYAAFAIEGCFAEITFHKSLELAEVGVFHTSVDYDDWMADFNAEFHELRGDPEFRSCLDPNSYRTSQALAARLLEEASNGVVYTNVRATGQTNLACFRPPLVQNVRKGATYSFTWDGEGSPSVEEKK